MMVELSIAVLIAGMALFLTGGSDGRKAGILCVGAGGLLLAAAAWIGT